jgi:hypothetical protein
LQFYVNKEIQLKRVIPSYNTKLNGGKVIFAKGKRIEIIRIKTLTPGICIKSSDSKIGIAFENNLDNLLWFKPSEKSNNYQQYILGGVQQKDEVYHVNYGSNLYPINQNNCDAGLLIPRKIAKKQKRV